MTCKIIFGKKKDGSIDKSVIQEVKAPNGNRSLLFDTIRDNIKEDIKSLEQYAITHTDEFRKWSESKPKDENNEVSYDTFNAYSVGINKFNLFSGEEYSKDSRKYIEEVDRVTRLIENKLKIKERPFRGKTSDEFIEKKDYLNNVFKKLLNNIGLPDSITTLEELKNSLNNDDVLIYIQKEYDLAKERSIETKDKLDDLNSNISILNGFLKSNNINDYPKEKQDFIKKVFPALFGDLGNYKSKSQALNHYKQIINTHNFLNKKLNLDYIKKSYFKSQGRLTKFENLLNYNTLAPDDFKNRIYTFIENELNRRSEFFTTPKMQTAILAEKEKIAQINYSRSAKGLLERLSNNTNTISGKISNLFLQHPKTLSAISAEHINKSIFGFSGGEWKGDGTLIVNYKDETSLRHVLLHELTHHFTVPYVITYLKKYSNSSKYEGFIERFPSKEELVEEIQYEFDSLTKEEIDSISKIEDIYIHILKLHKEGKIKFTNKEFSANPEYGLENLYEFLSEVISNPYFAAEIAKQPSIYNKKSNLLKDIIHMIYKMFGITNTSLLDDIYVLFEESFLNKDYKYTFKDISTPDVTFNYDNQPLASLNPVSDDAEQDAEIRNKFRKINGERPKWTWEFASAKAKEFNTNNKKYPDNKYFRAESIKYEDNGKVYYRTRLIDKNKPVASSMSGRTSIKELVAQRYFTSNDTSRKAYDVVKEIAESNHSLSKLAETLLDYVKYNNVNIRLSEESHVVNKKNGQVMTAAGTYWHGNNEIVLYVNENIPDNFLEKLILHEVIHAVTHRTLKSNTEANRIFNKLYDYAKTQIPNWKDVYEMHDIDEFMVGIFTDSNFMRMLSDIKPMSGIKQHKNLLEEIIDFFLSFIKVDKSNPSLYQQAFATATNILEDFKQSSMAAEEYNEMMQFQDESMFDDQGPLASVIDNDTIDNLIDNINLIKEKEIDIYDYNEMLDLLSSDNDIDVYEHGNFGNVHVFDIKNENIQIVLKDERVVMNKNFHPKIPMVTENYIKNMLLDNVKRVIIENKDYINFIIKNTNDKIENSKIKQLAEEKDLDWDLIKSMLASDDVSNHEIVRQILLGDDSQFKKIETQFQQPSTNTEQKKAYQETLDKLSSRFGIKYTIINNPHANWVGRYKPDGTIEINEAFIDQYPDAPFHEFFHPFLDVIEKNNSKLFNALKQEIDSLLKSTDPKDANLKSLLNRILNDKDYTNPDGTLNALGYKEAITELVGAHALKAHNDEWRRRVKATNPEWKQTGWDKAVEGPGMSEARFKKTESLMEQLWNYVRNIINKILRPSDPKTSEGFTSGNIPLLPSELNPNMTLSDLGYLMGQGTSPVKLDLEASRDMPVQYKKFSDNQWVNVDAYADKDKYTDAQRAFLIKYNQINENLDDTDNKVEVEVEKLSDKRKAQILKKKQDKIRLYKLRKENAKGRNYVENRVSMAQDLKFLERSHKTREELKAMEDAPGSELAREMGTELHSINEGILDRLLELDLPIDFTTEADGSLWAEKILNEVMKEDAFYKAYVEEIKKGNTPFQYEEVYDDTPMFDEDGEVVYSSTVKKDATRSYDEMIKSMLRLYHEVYAVQNKIDPTKKPIFLTEMPLYDEKSDTAGTTDFMVIFSDSSALIYDHKFINFKYNKVTLADLKKRPEWKGKTDAEILNYIYEKREKQGYGTERWTSSKYPNGNQWFYEIDDNNIQALYRWKQDSYEMQLSKYSDMLLNLYGVKRMRQVRVVPNAVSFNMVLKPDPTDSSKKILDLEKSKLQFLMTGSGENSLLKQLPTKAELTDDKHTNQFIKRLEEEKDKIRKQLDKKGWDNNPSLTAKFNDISDAITSLKVENGLMKVVDIVANLAKDLEFKLSQDKTIKEKQLQADGTEIEVEIPNPQYMNLSDINSYLEEIELYAQFVKGAYGYIKNLEKENKEQFNTFTTALNHASGQLDSNRTMLKQESLNRLQEINRDKKLMSEQRFSSYEQQADINSIERYFTNLTNVRHPLVNMFSKLYEKVVYNRMQAEKKLIADIEKYNNELTSWAKSKGITIYKAYEMMLNKDKNLIGKWNDKYYSDFKAHRNNEKADTKWFKENFKRSDDQESYFQNKKKKQEEFLKKKYPDTWKEEMEKWLNKNDIMYNNGDNLAWLFVEPARDVEPKNPDEYYNDKYKFILANKPLKEFYDFYRSKNIELSKMVDFKIGSNFVAEIHKDMIDTMVQNGISGTKMAKDAFNNIKNSFYVQENRDIINIDGTDRSIPIMFTDAIRTEDKSVDLAKSMVIFASYVNQYAGLKELESVAKSLRTLIANTDVVKVDSKGNKVKLEGTAQFETIQKDNKQILALFDSMISHYIYGESFKTGHSAIDPQVGKLINKAVEINSKKNIAFNLLSATAGHIGSMAQMNKLAKDGKIYTAKQLSDARSLLGRKSKNAMFAWDFFMVETENLTRERAGQLNKNALRNKYTKGGAYILQRNSEDILNHTILLAMMYNYSIDPTTNKAERIELLKEKYKDDDTYGKNYTWPTMYDMIQLGEETGKMINPHTNKPFEFDEFNSFRRKVLEVAKKTRGSASEEDIAAYKTTLVGKVLMQFKSWMPAMLRERIKKQQYDVAMEEFEVGSWVAMWNMMKAGKANAFGQLMMNMIPFVGSKFGFAADSPVFNDLYEQWKTNNPEDYAEMMIKFGLDPDNEMDVIKANELIKKEFINEYVGKVKGTAKEFQMYLMLMMLMLLIWWGAGDDEEDRNPLVRGAINLLQRAMLEVGFFLPGFDFMTTQSILGKGEFEMGKMITKSPVPMFGVVLDVFKGVANAGSEVIDAFAGVGPDEYYDMFNIGDESMANPFNPKIKKDSAPLGKYATPYLFSGAKGLTDVVGFFDTTDKKDSVWDWVFGSETASSKR